MNEDISITLDEVRAWVEAQPEGSVVAYCRDPERCVIANALKAKYPDQNRISVYPHAETLDIGYMRGTDPVYDFHFYPWEDEDGQALARLANAFDGLDFDLEGPVTREAVLALFETEGES